MPAGGQQWTSLKELRDKNHKNKWEDDPDDPRVTQIWTEPKVIFCGSFLYGLISAHLAIRPASESVRSSCRLAGVMSYGI